ncbi:MAG: zf-HC2 domain-containing protein [Gemmataceae bacterium]
MTCRDVLDFLMDYDTGQLPAQERALFDSHLAICPSCVAYLQNYRATVRLGKTLATAQEAPIPPELVRAILLARAGRQSP